MPKDVLAQRKFEMYNDDSCLLLSARRKSVFGIRLSDEEQTELSGSAEYQAAERWIAARTGGYGQIMPASPKANAANTR